MLVAPKRLQCKSLTNWEASEGRKLYNSPILFMTIDMYLNISQLYGLLVIILLGEEKLQNPIWQIEEFSTQTFSTPFTGIFYIQWAKSAQNDLKQIIWWRPLYKN